MQANPTRELTVEFAIQDIKKNMDAIIKASAGSYQFVDRNEAFNTYRISTVSGLLVGIISLSLEMISEGKTKIRSEIHNAAGSNAQAATLGRFQDEFLNILGKSLSGEEINNELISKNKSGCFGVILFISIIIIVSLFYQIHQ